ncbi:hypothetical protein [Merismopedia glauca]|uniref:hypothetical protein n=1 Tax=Merismopedia glauca TaxID=292586 RepID=UPI0011B292E5|nr:hypothetical protein [Merismopedia glauca]
MGQIDNQSIHSRNVGSMRICDVVQSAQATRCWLEKLTMRSALVSTPTDFPGNGTSYSCSSVKLDANCYLTS